MKTMANEVKLFWTIEGFALFMGMLGLVALVMAQSGKGIF